MKVSAVLLESSLSTKGGAGKEQQEFQCFQNGWFCLQMLTCGHAGEAISCITNFLKNLNWGLLFEYTLTKKIIEK